MKRTITYPLAFMVLILISCQPPSANNTKTEKGLVKVAILYPSGDGKTFDMDYYTDKHMPMVADLFGDPLKRYAIDKGVAGRTPEEPLPYVAVGYFYFNTLTDYQNAFSANAEKILSDIPNYTNIQPVVQISEVVY